MWVQSILRKKGDFVATIAPSATTQQAAQALAEHRVGALVVSSDGETIEGILSERDLARAMAEHGETVVSIRVEELMTREVTTCTDRDPVDRLMSLMTEQRIRHVPVVESGRLVGIISIGDVVKSRLDELEQEARTLHDYITTGR